MPNCCRRFAAVIPDANSICGLTPATICFRGFAAVTNGHKSSFRGFASKTLRLFSTIALLFLLFTTSNLNADEINKELTSFVQTNCLDCHDESTETRLDFSKLSKNLNNTNAFQKWVKIFDRVNNGEMPPSDAEQLEKKARENFLASLNSQLKTKSLAKQKNVGRVPSRRLSRLEYEHTLHDLLGIGGEIAKFLPTENTAGSFDVIGSKQEMSPVHVQGFLTAAKEALNETIQLGRKPNLNSQKLDYLNAKYFQMWVDRPLRMGGGTVFKTDDYIVTFRGANYVLRSDQQWLSHSVCWKLSNQI